MWLLLPLPALADPVYLQAPCEPQALLAWLPQDGADGLPADTVITLVFDGTCSAGIPEYQAILRGAEPIPLREEVVGPDAVQLIPEEALADGAYELDVAFGDQIVTSRFRVIAEQGAPALQLEADVRYRSHCERDLQTAWFEGTLATEPRAGAVVTQHIDYGGTMVSEGSTVVLTELNAPVSFHEDAPMGTGEACWVGELSDVTGTVVDEARACFEARVCPRQPGLFSCSMTSMPNPLGALALLALLGLRRRS